MYFPPSFARDKSVVFFVFVYIFSSGRLSQEYGNVRITVVNTDSRVRGHFQCSGVLDQE